MIYFTSDTHFFHKLMVKERGFSSIEEMHEVMLEIWNRIVKKGDIVYHLGDLALAPAKVTADFVNKLNGTIRLIKGNHDSSKETKKLLTLTNKIEWFKDVYGEDFSCGGQTEYIWLSHYGHRVWPKRHYGSWHLYGHSHGNLPPYGKSFDVGVDCWTLEPLSIKFVFHNMNNLELEPYKHHVH